jgi:hypothetical protein
MEEMIVLYVQGKDCVLRLNQRKFLNVRKTKINSIKPMLIMILNIKKIY